MTLGEIIEMLIKAENYTTVRTGISDDTMHIIQEMLPSDYKYIQEKEEAYQELLKILKDNDIR